MRATDFDEIAFLSSRSRQRRTRSLIGRRVLVLLGLPVLTADYDFWIGIDDISRFNDAVAPFGLQPNRYQEDAGRTGRYALENDEHVDVLVARSVPTSDGAVVLFETLWQRRRALALEPDVLVQVPTIAVIDLDPAHCPLVRGISKISVCCKSSSRRNSLDSGHPGTAGNPECTDTEHGRGSRLDPEVPIGDDEREQVLSLVRWFKRRYPTPLDRLAVHSRRLDARWRRVTACAASNASSASDTR